MRKKPAKAPPKIRTPNPFDATPLYEVWTKDEQGWVGPMEIEGADTATYDNALNFIKGMHELGDKLRPYLICQVRRTPEYVHVFGQLLEYQLAEEDEDDDYGDDDDD